MLLRICSALSLDDDSPNGEGSMLRYFLGDEDEDDGDTGMHLRLLGEVGLISGSKSMVLFRVAPHAMTLGETLVCQTAFNNFSCCKSCFPKVEVPISQLWANCLPLDRGAS